MKTWHMLGGIPERSWSERLELTSFEKTSGSLSKHGYDVERVRRRNMDPLLVLNQSKTSKYGVGISFP